MKKILSVLLVAVMLFSSLGLVSVVAADAPALSYTVTGSYALDVTSDVTKELFSIDIAIDESKFAALDGESRAYTYKLDSVIANGVDYLVDEDAFFSSFDAEDYAGTTLEITFTVDFESDKVFGTLDYTISVMGFTAPLAIGLGPVDDALSGVGLPVEINIDGNVWEFPSVDTTVILNRPNKDTYLDNEKVELDGTTIAVQTKVATDRTETASGFVYTYEPGYAGTITYGKDTANMFTTNPVKSENLNINVTEIITYFDGIEFAKVPVQVDHAWSTGYVGITTDLYTDAKPGYHAIVCDGCGEAHDAQPHTPTPILDEEGNPIIDEEGNYVCWTPNNDQTFLKNGTESSTCSDCGAVLTRNTFGTADYNTALGDYHFIRVILDYINALLRIINGAV